MTQPPNSTLGGREDMPSHENESVNPAMGAVLSYFRDELLPVIAELQVLAEDIARFQVGFAESIRRKRLRALEGRYVQLMARFMGAYKKWHFPDEMFKGIIGASYHADVIAEYQRMKPALSEHIQEGFRVLGFIDRLIGGARAVADNRVAVILSIAAITVSIIVALVPARCP